MQRRTFITAILIVWPVLSLLAGGSAESNPSGTGASDIDYLGVAAVMIRDGNFERARTALESVDTGAEEFDAARYYTLAGLVALRSGENERAADAFAAAVDAGQSDPTINVYLAQAYYSTGRYEETVRTIESVQNLRSFPALYGVQAEALWQLERREEAFSILSRAISLFPSQTQFRRQRILYLIEQDLTRQAAEESVAYLAVMENDPEAYITIGEALRRGGISDLALQTLESARIRYPDNERILLVLAQAYLSADLPRAAASIVEEAAARNPALAYDAAEIYRRAGDFQRALYLNTQVTDADRKSLQRFNILLGMERYEEAVALEPRLNRSGAVSDDAVRYALAYALFQVRNLSGAAEYANRIESSDYFRHATQLRRAIETVRSERYQYF